SSRERRSPAARSRGETSGFPPDPPFRHVATGCVRARAKPALAPIHLAVATRNGGWPMSGMDFGKLAEQAQKMQAELKRLQAEAAGELLADLVTAAVNEALRSGRSLLESKLGSLLPGDLGGLLPGM